MLTHMVDLANLKWKDFQDYEIVNKNKYLRDSATEHRYYLK